MNLSDVVDFITDKLNSVKTPANTLPPILLKATAMTRQGLCPYRLAANIIKNNSELKIPTDSSYNGQDNIVNQFIFNISKCIVDTLKKDAAIHVAIPMQSLNIMSNGGNAGGPVVTNGTNITDSIGKGIIQ